MLHQHGWTQPHSTGTDTTSQTATLAQRLFLFWNGSWDTLLTESTPTQTPHGLPPDDTRLAERVEKLTQQGVVGRASSILTSPPKYTTNPADLKRIKALFTMTRQKLFAAQPTQPPNRGDHLLPALTKHLNHYPRNKQPGPDGSRNEHWATITEDETTLKNLSIIVTRLQHGHLPAESLDAALTTQLAAKLKANRSIRPLAVGTAIRRITAAAIQNTYKQQIHKAAGTHQYGVGRPNGADQIFKLVEQRFTEHPTHTIIHLDITNAFPSLPRQHLISAITANCPSLAPTVQSWYARPSTTLWRDNTGTTHRIQTDCGVAQGCALSAAIYAISIANTNTAIQQVLTATTTNDTTTPATQARILAYLDDTYLLVPTEHAKTALETAR